MVLNTIKNFVSGENSSAGKNYKQILENLSLNEADSNHQEDIQMIKNAFDIGYTAHKGQLRKSGEEYFTHCMAVGVQLSSWNMDRDVVIAGLLHDTLEDTDLTKKDIENYKAVGGDYFSISTLCFSPIRFIKLLFEL